MTRRMTMWVAIAALAFMALAMAPTAAASAGSTLYVGPGGGSDSCFAPGYGTISDGVAAANPGDTVVVCPGTYNEVVAVGKAITLRGTDGAVIKPDDTTALLDQGVRRVAVYVTADDVAVQGFEIDGTGGTVHFGVYAFNAANVVVKGNTIHDMSNDASDVAGVGILYFGWGQGIAGADIERNTVYNTARHGIFVGGMQSATPYAWLLSDGGVIAGNTVFATWLGPTADAGAGIQVNGAVNTLIEGNVVHHTGSPTDFGPGVYVAGSASGNTIADNNIHHNQYGIVVWVNAPFVEFGTQTPTTPMIQGNKLHQNAAGDVWLIP